MGEPSAHESALTSSWGNLMDVTSVRRVQTPLLVNDVASSLRDAINRGHYPAGHHLVERAIASEYGASSIVVREVFARLEDEGLVNRVPRRGAFVMSMSADDVRDLTRVRVVLEELAVELSLAHWSRANERNLSSIVNRMYVAARRGDTEDFSHLDEQFHEAFLRLSGSPTIQELASKLRGRITHFLRQADARRDTVQMKESADAHREWLAAVAAQDLSTAKREVRHHISSAGERVARSLETAEAPGSAATDERKGSQRSASSQLTRPMPRSAREHGRRLPRPRPSGAGRGAAPR